MRKNYCSVQHVVCHESQRRFDFKSLLGCQCDDEDDCVVVEEGQYRHPVRASSRQSYSSRAFKWLIKPLPDFLPRRDEFVSVSSDCYMFVTLSFAFLLRFCKVTAQIQWPLHTFCIQRIFPGLLVPTSFLPCSHVGMIFQCDCIILNNLFLSPPNI